MGVHSSDDVGVHILCVCVRDEVIFAYARTNTHARKLFNLNSNENRHRHKNAETRSDRDGDRSELQTDPQSEWVGAHRSYITPTQKPALPRCCRLPEQRGGTIKFNWPNRVAQPTTGDAAGCPPFERAGRVVIVVVNVVDVFVFLVVIIIVVFAWLFCLRRRRRRRRLQSSLSSRKSIPPRSLCCTFSTSLFF